MRDTRKENFIVVAPQVQICEKRVLPETKRYMNVGWAVGNDVATGEYRLVTTRVSQLVFLKDGSKF